MDVLVLGSESKERCDLAHRVRSRAGRIEVANSYDGGAWLPQLVVTSAVSSASIGALRARLDQARGMRPRPLILAMVRCTSPGAARAALEAGADDCLPACADDASLAMRLDVLSSRTELAGVATAVAVMNEEMLALTFGSAPIGMVVTDEDGVFVSVNRAYCEMFGYAEHELIGQSFLVTLRPGDRARMLGRYRSLVTTTGRTFGTWSARRKDGSACIVRVSAAGFARSDGRRFVVTSFVDVTAQREAEAMAVRLGRILEQGKAELYVLDSASLRILQANQSARRNLGYTAAELSELTILDIVVDATREQLEQATAGLRTGESELLILTREHRRKDGSRYPVEARLMLSRTEGPVLLVGIVEDTTERRQTEEALRRTEEYVRSLVDQAPIILIGLDTRGVFTFSAGAGLEVLGRQPNEAVGTSIFDTYGRDPVVGDVIRSALDGQPASTVAEVAGHLWDIRYRPTRGRDGNVNGAIGVCLDITERRRAETRIHEAAADLRAVFESVRDGIMLLSPGGNVLGFNSAAADGARRWFGREMSIGEDIAHYNEAAALQDFGTLFEDALSGTATTVERQMGSPPRRWIEYTFTPVRLESGETRGVALAARDITGRKRAEGKLLQAQKLESLAVLAGGIAHDFNNLLVGILGNAGIALEEVPPNSPARITLECIETAGRRAADLARQMLAYSGKGRFVIERVALNGLVEEMTHLLRVSISKSAVLKYDFTNSLPTVEADATQLRQVVMNLVVNASDAIGENYGVVTISTGSLDVTPEYLAETFAAPNLPGGTYVYLDIADTGAGMGPATQARIFDPFFTTKFAGRGLGLAAVLGIVRGHRGAIRVTSEPGRGTTFRLLLPAQPETSSPDERRQPAEGRWKGSGLILVVDDEPTVRAVTARALRACGFDVVEAADGQWGVEIFTERASEIRCVLLDMTMPRMNGEEAFREIRRIRPEVPVVLMSGYTEHDTMAAFPGSGLAGFLQKPYDIKTLQTMLQRAVNGKP